MKTQRTHKSATSAALVVVVVVLTLSALIIFAAYRTGGRNGAVSAGTAVGVGLWLWSARRSYRKQALSAGARLTVDRVGE